MYRCVWERYKPREMACAFVSVFCYGGDFVNVFVGICVDDISNKNLTHAMCVKKRPIYI